MYYFHNDIKVRTLECKDENQETWVQILPLNQSSSMKAGLGLCCIVYKMSSLSYLRHTLKVSYAQTSFSPLPRKIKLNGSQTL